MKRLRILCISTPALRVIPCSYSLFTSNFKHILFIGRRIWQTFTTKSHQVSQKIRWSRFSILVIVSGVIWSSRHIDEVCAISSSRSSQHRQFYIQTTERLSWPLGMHSMQCTVHSTRAYSTEAQYLARLTIVARRKMVMWPKSSTDRKCRGPHDLLYAYYIYILLPIAHRSYSYM